MAPFVVFRYNYIFMLWNLLNKVFIVTVFQFNIDFEKSSSVSQRNLASFYHRFHCGCSSNMCGCELYAVCPNQMLQTNSYSVVDGATVSKLIQILALDFIHNIIIFHTILML